MSSVKTELEGIIESETDEAYLFAGDDLSVWIPRSLVFNLEYTDEETGECIITVPEWLAIDKELI